MSASALTAAREPSPASVAAPRRHIGRAQAQRVAEAFLAAPRHAPSPLTVAAYAQLGEQSTR